MQRRRMVAVAFYAATSIGLLVLVTRAQAMVLPAGLASQIGHNSEALAFALLLALIIDRLPPGARSPRTVATLLGLAVALMVAGALLQRADLPPTLVTLNEPLYGAGFISAYLALRRPLRWAPLVSLAVLGGIVALFDTAFVLDQAESLVPLLLAPLALDVFDRRILEPDAPDSIGLRVVWMAVLVVVAFGAMLAARTARQDLGGGLSLGIDYAQRAAEAYWGWFLVHAYFWLKRSVGRGLARERAERRLEPQ